MHSHRLQVWTQRKKAAQSAYAVMFPFKATAPERTLASSTPAVRELRSVRNHIRMYMKISRMCYVISYNTALQAGRRLLRMDTSQVTSRGLFVSSHIYCSYKSTAAKLIMF